MLTLEQIFAPYNIKYLSSANEYRCDCVFEQFHAHRADSGKAGLVLNPEINAYHCFSCGSHGNLIGLLTTKMKVGFVNAYEIVSITNIERIIKGKEARGEIDFDFIVPKKIPQSMLERGFTREILEYFQVGCDGDTTFIPYYDNSGAKIVAIKCRKDRMFWWLPKGFGKENYIYNYHNCLPFDWCVLCEGETDVYRSMQNGIPNTCAIAGGTLSDEQANLLSRFKTVLLAMDNDAPGFKKCDEAYMKLRTKTHVKVVPYDAKDPGECDKVVWAHGVENAADYATYKLIMEILK